MTKVTPIKVPKFKRASQAAEWIAATINAKNWYKGALAAGPEDEEGERAEYDFVHDKNVVAFCALGWCEKANQGFEETLKQAIANAIAPPTKEDLENEDLPSTDVVPNFNDDKKTTVAQVRAVFRKAAKALAKQEAAKPAKKKAHTKG